MNLVGRVLDGRYQLTSQIGSGGMGVVYEAVHLELKRRVAVKVLFEQNPQALGRFRQEAFAAASISHPNVVAVTDFGGDDATMPDLGEPSPPFIVMELLAGRTLFALLTQERRLSVTAAVSIATQMLDGLDAAHAMGVVHRDVKPGNVFLIDLPVGDHLVKIVDFGLAKLTEGQRGVRTATGAFVGTPAYSAPEQILGGSIDARTDIHAVSVCLYMMLTGKHPFRNEGDAAVDIGIAIMRSPAPAMDDGTIPRGLANVVTRGLEKNPEARWGSARAMADALKPWLARREASVAAATMLSAPFEPSRNVPKTLSDARVGGTELVPPIAARPPTAPPPAFPLHAETVPIGPPRPSRSAWPFAIALGVTLLLLLLGGGALLLRRQLQAPAAPTPAATPLVGPEPTLAPRPTTPSPPPSATASAPPNESIPSPPTKPIALYAIKSITPKNVDPAAGREWVRRNEGPMRASCMHTQPCYDLVYVSGDGTPHGTRSPRLDKLPHCQTSRARGVQIECLDRYVASHPLPPASCPDDAYDCPRSATITFY